MRSSFEAPNSSSLSKIKSSLVDSDEDAETGVLESFGSSSGYMYLDLCEAEMYGLESFCGIVEGSSGWVSNEEDLAV